MKRDETRERKVVENARESRQGKDGNHAFASGVRHESVAERRGSIRRETKREEEEEAEET